MHCRILVTYLPKYADQNKSVVWHIEHERQVEMEKKSTIVHLTVIIKCFYCGSGSTWCQ